MVSTKIDKLNRGIARGLDSSSKEVSDFTDKLTPIVRELRNDPAKYITGEDGLIPIGAAKEAVQAGTEVNVSLRNVSYAKEVSDIPYVGTLVDKLQGFTTAINTVGSLLESTQSLLEALSLLSANLDDSVYLLVKSLLSQIEDLLNLLAPSAGVSALVIPPSPPVTRKNEDPIDTRVLEFYSDVSSGLRDILSDPDSLIIRDRDYFSKGYSTAIGTADLKTLIDASIDDKYDTNRPFSGDRTGMSHSAGVILTAGGSLDSVYSIYRDWCKVIGYELPVNKDAISPSITSVSYRKNVTGSGYSIDVNFNLSGYKYIPHQPVLYIPFEYKIVFYRGDTIPEPLLTETIWDTIGGDTTEYDQAPTVAISPQGVFRFQAQVLTGDFNSPFTDRATDSSILLSFFNNLEISRSISVSDMGDYRVYVSVRSKRNTRLPVPEPYVDKTSSRSILIEAKKSTSTPGTPPNWYGGTLKVPGLSYLEESIGRVSSLMKSLTERAVSGYLDSSLQVISDYIDLLQDVRSKLDDIISVLDSIANFRVGGYASVFRADSGVTGLKKAVEEHMSYMPEHKDDTMSAIVIVGESDTVSDLELLLSTLGLLFGVDLASSQAKKIGCGDYLSPSTSSTYSIPEEVRGSLPSPLRCP